MDATIKHTYPLDLLSVEEIATAVSILKASKSLADTVRFPIIRLEEPDKAAIAAFRKGAPLPRLAFILSLDISTGETHEIDHRSFQWRSHRACSSAARNDTLWPASGHALRV